MVSNTAEYMNNAGYYNDKQESPAYTLAYGEMQ